MNTLSEFQPNWISTPGQTISDILEEKRMSVNSLAKNINLTSDFIDELIQGEREISDRIAKQLEKNIGGTAEFWLRRERQYQDHLLSLKEIEDKEWVSSLPIKDMVGLGWIKKTKNNLEECLNFFNVSNVEEWRQEYQGIMSAAMFRNSASHISKTGSVSAWLRQGEIMANTIDCEPWNPELLENEANKFKSLTRIKKPSIFIPLLVEALAKCGIALSIVKTPSGCPASGATKFLSKTKAMLLISFRYLSDDQFWFTLFHELGHLLLHSEKNMFIETDGINRSQEEADANFFAGEMLIPSEYHQNLRMLKRNKREIISFAAKLEVSPGIVIGQLQHHGIIDFKYLNSYKRRYNWEEINNAYLNL